MARIRRHSRLRNGEGSGGHMVVKIARIAAWLLVAAIVVMTLGPPTVRPVSGFNRSLEHVAAFALLGLAFGLAYPNKRMLLALIGVTVAALLETLQLVVPGRHAYFADFVINAAGACGGLVVAALLYGLRRRYGRAKKGPDVRGLGFAEAQGDLAAPVELVHQL